MTTALDKDGNELTDLAGTPVPVRSDGTIDLYHRTSDAAKAAILGTGKWQSAEQGEVFFSTFRDGGQNTGFGNAVVHVRILPRYVSASDAFWNGEVHVSVRIRDLQRYGHLVGRKHTTR